MVDIYNSIYVDIQDNLDPFLINKAEVISVVYSCI